MEKKEYSTRQYEPDRYYNTSYLLWYIEGAIDESIEEIEDDINKAHVYVSEDKIIRYLNCRFAEEDGERMLRMQQNKYDNSKDGNVDMFMDRLEAKHYIYDKASLRHYERYLEVLRTKTKTILAIIKAISARVINEDIQELLDELDIELSERGKSEFTKGKILGSDIQRLAQPFLYLYNELYFKWEEANTLESYYEWDSSDHVKVDKYIPSPDLQANTEYSERFGKDAKGFIPHTKKQLVRREKIRNENLKTVLDMLD